MKNVINSFSHDLWLSNLTEGWLMIKSHMSNSKVTCPSNHVVTWGHLANERHYIFILQGLLPLKLTGWWLVKSKSRQQLNYYMVIWLVFRFLSKFWLKWKNSSGQDTLFLKHLYFSVNFTNFLTHVCVEQFVLKIWFLNQEKNFWSALR